MDFTYSYWVNSLVGGNLSGQYRLTLEGVFDENGPLICAVLFHDE